MRHPRIGAKAPRPLALRSGDTEVRVLHVYKTYWPDTFGGAERTIHALAKGCSAQGIETEVLSLSRDPAENTLHFDGHTAHKAKLNFELASTGFSLEFFSKYRKLGERADVIHYHFPWPLMDIAHLTCRQSAKTVVTYQSDVVKQKSLLKLYSPLMHHFLSSVDHIVATSPNYVASSPVLQRHRGSVSLIPLGLDEADYSRAGDAEKNLWQARFARPFFLFVGVLRYYKGIHVLVDAARHIDADVVIAGTGPLEAQMRERAERIGARNVHFIGAVSDESKAALLELCTAFVFPSHLRSEAYGLSLVEASMFGKPMVTCEIATGTSFVNIDRRTGLVVEPDDPAQLAGALQTLCQDDRLREALGQGARARYLDELTASKMVNRYVDLYTAKAGRT